MGNKVEVIEKSVFSSTGITAGTKKRVAAYCRVSTDLDVQKASYESQVSFYRQYISENPAWVFAGIYADEAITGTKTDKRIQFQKMINDAKDRKIDLILCKSISRFARNTVDTLQYVRLLKNINVEVYFEEENIRTLSMDGEMLLAILSSVAQQEVTNISEHIRAGFSHRMQQGIMVGNQNCLGYDFSYKDQTLTVNREEAEIVHYIFDRYIAGVGATAICYELEEAGHKTKIGNSHWSPPQILAIIRNEKYVGDLMQGKTFTLDPLTKTKRINRGERDRYLIRNHHEPIISREVFAEANRILEKRSQICGENASVKRERYSKKYPFSSKLICGFCGEYLTRKSWHTGTPYEKINWGCRVSTRKGKKNCPCSKHIHEKVIQDAFVASFNSLAKMDEAIVSGFLARALSVLNAENAEEDKKKTVNDILKYEKQFSALLDLRLNEKITPEQFDEKAEPIQRKLKFLNYDLDILEKDIEHIETNKKRVEEFRNIISQHKTMTQFDGEIFNLLIEEVIVGEKKKDKYDPYKLIFVYKSGLCQTADAEEYREDRRRKHPSSFYTKDSSNTLDTSTSDTK